MLMPLYKINMLELQLNLFLKFLQIHLQEQLRLFLMLMQRLILEKIYLPHKLSTLQHRLPPLIKQVKPLLQNQTNRQSLMKVILQALLLIPQHLMKRLNLRQMKLLVRLQMLVLKLPMEHSFLMLYLMSFNKTQYLDQQVELQKAQLSPKKMQKHQQTQLLIILKVVSYQQPLQITQAILLLNINSVFLQTLKAHILKT